MVIAMPMTPFSQSLTISRMCRAVNCCMSCSNRMHCPILLETASTMICTTSSKTAKPIWCKHWRVALCGGPPRSADLSTCSCVGLSNHDAEADEPESDSGSCAAGASQASDSKSDSESDSDGDESLEGSMQATAQRSKRAAAEQPEVGQAGKRSKGTAATVTAPAAATGSSGKGTGRGQGRGSGRGRGGGRGRRSRK